MPDYIAKIEIELSSASFKTKRAALGDITTRLRKAIPDGKITIKSLESSAPPTRRLYDGHTIKVVVGHSRIDFTEHQEIDQLKTNERFRDMIHILIEEHFPGAMIAVRYIAGMRDIFCTTPGWRATTYTNAQEKARAAFQAAVIERLRTIEDEVYNRSEEWVVLDTDDAD